MEAEIVRRGGPLAVPDAGVGVLDKRPDLLDAFSDRVDVGGEIARGNKLVWDDAARSVAAPLGVRKSDGDGATSLRLSRGSGLMT